MKKAVDLGYLDAAFSVHAMRISMERRRGDIELVLQTGTPYRFGEVVFQGLAGYPESFLRRYITFKPGDAFSYEEMARTQANYVNADRFREVVVNAGKEAAGEGILPVEIGLTPGPTKSVRLGAGYGTDTGPRATLRYRDVNMFDRGQEWHTEAKISPVLQGISSRYLFPSQRDWQTYTALSAGAHGKIFRITFPSCTRWRWRGSTGSPTAGLGRFSSRPGARNPMPVNR